MTVDSATWARPPGKDLATEKATWPAVFGIEQSQRDAATLIDEAFAALKPTAVELTDLNPLHDTWWSERISVFRKPTSSLLCGIALIRKSRSTSSILG